MSVSRIENVLGTLVQREHARLTGRATSALIILFSLLRKNSKGHNQILMPAVMCPHPAYAAQLAGCEPVFVDVDPVSGTMDPGALAKTLNAHPDATAILVVHTFGHPADMNLIGALAKEHDIPIIEDVAQALGGTFEGQPLGSFGLASVFSFRRTKIVDIGHGGAVASNDQALMEAFDNIAETLGNAPDNAAEISEDWRTEYYRAWGNAKAGADSKTEFQYLPEIFAPLAMVAFDSAYAEALNNGLQSLTEHVQMRRAKSELYTDALHDLPITFPETTGQPAPWRQIGHIASDIRAGVVNHMRARQFDISEWYPSLGPQFGASTNLAKANEFEHSVINLWLDEATDTDRVSATAAGLREAIQHNLERVGA